MHTAQSTSSHARRHLQRGLAAGLILSQALTGFAQTAPTPSDEEKKEEEKVFILDAFNVTAGFSGSLAAAAEIKQKQTLITEVIAAEDIGKLPDISIAESLTRLPGLTSQRTNGRAQAIVIRGLNANFGMTLLNGREQVSTGAGRGVEFDQYPAELLSGAVVYKSTNTALVSQGISGTVDLQTVRPLSQGRRVIAGNFFYEWNEMKSANAGADNTGERYTFTYIDQFMDGKLGLAFGYAGSSRPGQGEQWNAWGYPNVDSGTASSQPLVLGGAKPFVRTSDLARDGYMGVIEYKPSDWLHSTIDLYYSDFNESQLLRGIEIPLWWSSAQLQPGFTVSNGLITRGTFRNVYGVVRNDIVTRDAEVTAGGWLLEFGQADGWKVKADLSYSKIERRDLVLETYSGFASNQVGLADTMTYTLGGSQGATFQTALDYTNAGGQMRLTSPQGWASGDVPGGQVGFVKGPFTRDLLAVSKLSADRDLSGFFSRFEAGASYSKRAKYEFEAGPGGREGFFLALKNGATQAPLPASVGITDLSFLGIRGMYSYDPLALYNSGFYNLIPNNNPSYVANNWDVEEKVYLGYAMLEIDSKWGSIPVTGSIGTQIVQTDQTSKGLAANGSVITPVSDTHSYTDFVPALNLNFEVGERTMLRMSASRQLARQPMVDMRAGSTFGYNPALATSTNPLNSPWSGGGGNPKLEPWRSNSFDVSWERYFKDNMGYFAVAAFWKNLVSYTYNQTSVVSYAGYPTGLPAGAPGSNPVLNVGTRSIPQNGQGGNMRGLEFSLSLPGEKFADALKGFGFIGSTSFFKSTIRPDLGNPATEIPGLSDRVMSGTVYYERGGFGARLSARYRSDYRGDIATFGPRGEVFRNLQEETVVDAQVSYTFKEGPMKNLGIILQGYNLTDEPLFASQGFDTRLVQDYQRYGASYSIGVTYKY
jgi:iron complex outermembrane recepter protein